MERSSRDLDRTLLTHQPVVADKARDLPCLPGYAIVSELGRGAVGVVYKARHLALNRIVALKMLHVSRQDDTEQRRRFRTEVETIALLQHPNIVQVHDVGEHDGRPFFTMEHLDGGSLAEQCRGQAQAPRVAAEWVETLARAMHVVHAKGIVHRDLKPSNVLRTAEGCLKIADFGLAHQESSHLTVTGQVLGTPSYMAPEQAAGKVREVGPAADVYALGAILYELLTGRLPFRGATVMDVIRQVQDSDPLSLRRLEPHVPRDLETICLKCLRKQPSQRYGSAGELADDLRRYLNGESIHARPLAWPERSVRWLRRRPTVAVMLAVLVLAAVAVPLALLGHTLRLQEALDREQRAHEKADAAERLAHINEREAHIARYVSDAHLAHNLFKIGDVFQVPRLLGPYRDEDPAGDPRGFEWGYLQRHGQKARPVLAAHDGPLHLLAYSPDGRSLITAGGHPDHPALQVWDAQTRQSRSRQPLFHLVPCYQPAPSAYAASGGLLALWGHDHIISLCDFSSSQTRFRLRFVDDPRHLVLSPDGRWLAVSDIYRTTLCNCATGQTHKVLPVRDESSLAFSPDGGTLLATHHSASFYGLQWWDVATGSLREQRTLPDGALYASYSPRGTFLLLIEGNGQGAIWSARQCVALPWSSSLGAVRSLAVSEDERTLAAGDAEGRVRLWDIPSGRLCGQYRWQPNAIDRLAFAPDHRTLAAATVEGQVYQLDAAVCHAPDILQTFTMPDGSLAWSPDSETVAAAAWGGTVHLFDSRTATTRSILRCSFQNVHRLAFSPDGRTLAVVCEQDNFVRLWDVATGRLRALTSPQSSPVYHIAFCPDGRLASVDGKTIRFWDAAKGSACGSVETEQTIRATAFLPDGQSLLTANSTMQVWDISDSRTTPRKKSTTTGFAFPISHLAISPDGQRVATGETDGTIRLWRVSSQGTLAPEKINLSWPEGKEALTNLQFRADGKVILIVGLQRCLLCELRDGCYQDVLRGAARCGALSPNGRTLATTGSDGIVRLWDISAWRVRQPSGQAPNRVTSLVFSADGRTLITASSGPGFYIKNRKLWTSETAPLRSTTESLRFWDAATGRELPPEATGQETMTPPHIIAQSPDGRLLAAGGEDGSVRIWDGKQCWWAARLFVSDAAERRARIAELGRKLLTETNPDYVTRGEAVSALAFSRDGRRLAAASRWGLIRVWDTGDWKEFGRCQGASNGTPWLAFTPDGDAVAGSGGGRVCLWDARTGRIQATLGTETDSPVLCGVFVPDKPGAPATGATLAMGLKDGTICFWGPGRGDVKRLSGGHQDRVTCLAFSPDGKTLASAGWDHTVRLWNLAAGREVAALEGHKGRVHAVAFSPDGQTLVSGGEIGGDRGEVLFWR